MNIRQLKTFVAVVDSGSFSKAAQGLYTTPTSLTQQVNALERDLGFPLLDRTYRGVSLTPGGEVYCGYARQLLALADLALARAREAAGVGRQVVRVSSYRDVGVVLLQPYLDGFSQMCPDVEVEFVEGDYRGCLASLLADEVDLYIHPYGSELDQAGIGFQKMGVTRLCCSLSHDNPLASRASITPEDLAGRDVIVGCGCSSRSLDGVRRTLEAEHPDVNIRQCATDDEVRTQVLRHGALLLNMEFAARYLGSYAWVPLEWPERFDYGFAYRVPRRAAVGRLLDYVQTHAAEPAAE